uniref:Uncharacterized protein n=1 Tax=Ascaris lumbricoides TaxID=6252 RepID=A0A9J2QAJ0_ASCLU
MQVVRVLFTAVETLLNVVHVCFLLFKSDCFISFTIMCCPLN